jgi:hypothetical protein
LFVISLQYSKKSLLLHCNCPDGGIGRRAGLKHQWIHFHAGSIPALGTESLDNRNIIKALLFYVGQIDPICTTFGGSIGKVIRWSKDITQKD